MKKKNLIFTILIIMLAVSFVAAQNGPPPNDFINNQTDRPKRGDILARELRLTDEQKMQIRQINRQKRPQMRAAQQRFRQVKDELDMLIYADELDEVSLQNKVREVATAQAEIIKIRAMSEVAVRNVLSPEQLVKFRELRQRFKQQQKRRKMMRERRQRRRQMNQNRRRPF